MRRKAEFPLVEWKDNISTQGSVLMKVCHNIGHFTQNVKACNDACVQSFASGTNEENRRLRKMPSTLLNLAEIASIV